jgi:hypothetical protein
MPSIRFNHLFAVIIMSTLISSLVSEVMSMIGETIMMADLCLLLSIHTAMVLHGAAQALPNGSRIWLYSEHICRSILLPYTIGALGILALFSWVSFVPDTALVFVVVGTFFAYITATTCQVAPRYQPTEHRLVLWIAGHEGTSAGGASGASIGYSLC